ncbi:MAG: hypothetical protein H6611_07025 [Ignavibacteriales bacterium]|nr:hypothetical protein [Ignavibacteriales bacterium]
MVFRKSNYFLTLFAIILISSCSDNNDSNPLNETSYDRGKIIESTLRNTLSTSDIQFIVNAISPNTSLDLKYSVDVFSVEYYTTDYFNNEQIASGAIFVPKDLDDLSILSLQHGTETRSSNAASVSYLNSFEGIGGAIFGSLGYFMLVPDYLGFGVSDVDHPYMHAESLTPGIIDFIRAGKNFSNDENISLNGNLFLAGYSEGGYLTLATQKDIEQNYSGELILTGVAPMAGPYDFIGTVDTILSRGEYSTPYYVAYVLKAYNEIYNWNRLDDFFQSPYNTTVNTLYNGSYSTQEVVNQLPSSITDLLKSEFVDNYFLGNETELRKALTDNTLLNWTPSAPIHFFHGDKDDAVFYFNAIKAEEVFSSKGSNVQLTTIPDGTHGSSIFPSIVGLIDWLETFK